MKTFNEWLQTEDPQLESWLHKAIGAGLIGLAATGLTGCSGGKCDVGKPAATAKANGAWEEGGYVYGQATIRLPKLKQAWGMAAETAEQRAVNNISMYLDGQTSLDSKTEKIPGGVKRTTTVSRHAKSFLRGIETVKSQNNKDGTYTCIVRVPLR